MIQRRLRRPRGLALCVAAAISALLAVATPTLAAGIPHWRLESLSAPTNLPLNGKEGQIIVDAANLGGAKLEGSATITDKLPAGMEATEEPLVESRGTERSKFNTTEEVSKNVFVPLYKCSGAHTQTIVCTFEKQHLGPYEQLEIIIKVKVSGALEAEPANEVTVTGGEAPGGGAIPATPPLRQPLKVNEAETHFGVERFQQVPENENGSIDTQAGSHPYQLTTTFDLNQTLAIDYNSKNEAVETPSAPALEKNLHFKLPPGLIGNPNALPQCNDTDFGGRSGNLNLCPADTAVGAATVSFNDPDLIDYYTKVVPIFNLVPAYGEPAQFGFEVENVPIVLNTSLRAGGDYGVTVSVDYASQGVQVLSSRVSFWGVPTDPSHDAARGWGCIGFPADPCNLLEDPHPEPFLSLPTGEQSRLATSVSGEAWPQEDGKVETIEEGQPNTSYQLPSALTGSELLGFSPTISAYPVEDHGNGWSAAEEQEEAEGHEPAAETRAGSTPTGLRVHVHVPQTETLEAKGNADSAVKDTTVALPPGVLLNASAANGLEACAEGETQGSGGIGFTGSKEFEPGVEPGGTDTFTEKLPEPLEPGTNFCPNGSKVGTVRIKTPDLSRRKLPNGELSKPELVGGVYLASQYANPFGSLFAMYMVAEEKESGVLVKLAGEVEVTATGQVITNFKNTPDVGFEDLRLELFGGPRGSLTTPPACGPYSTTASFTPWAKKPTYPLPPSTFNITSGPGGAACAPSPLSFAPSFTAGSTNSQAGAYTPFTLTINKPDGQQSLKSINTTLPPGLAAKIASVTPCPNPQAIETLTAGPPPCGPESEIGTTTSVSGLGGEPVTLPGTLYLTKGIAGAPFGILASTHAKAGPFDLGWVNVLSTISVNEETAVVTTKTIGPIPQFIKGVPAQLKSITVTVGRPNFEFNPTNCNKLSVTGELGGWENAIEPVESPFQASNCAALGFKPDFKAYTSGVTSKEGGASLRVVINYPNGSYSNIAKSVTYLPYDLPSRLKPTIQHACPDYTFNPNAPQNCDPDSLIGEGIVHTPVFKNPLRGPAYLVSHANRSFPDVDIILTEPESGVKIVLDGNTDIKNGITKTTFERVPDAPVETFELVLPEGPHSALAANGNLCSETKTIIKVKHVTRKVKGKTKHLTVKVKQTVPETLVLPTTLTAQNGAVIEQQTPITVENCPKVAAFHKKKVVKKKVKKKKKKK